MTTMLRQLSQPMLRSSVRSTPFASGHRIASRRLISTAPPHARSRSWKNGALRWGIAIAGIYYYNTSPVFAEQPENNLLNPNVQALHDEDSEHSTLDALTASSRRKSEQNISRLQSVVETTSADDAATAESLQASPQAAITDASPGELEEEAVSEGAFNPETGEINWDCPCLGGMAHGPCGPEFREAFSCFVYSTDEPKGMNCIDKFQNMQNCFKQHPEVYKEELDDEELDAELAEERELLQKQIAERKAADDGAHEQAETNTSKKSAAKPRSSAKSSASFQNTESPAPSAKTTLEPHSGMPEGREAVNEGQRSAAISTPQTRPIDSGSTTEDDVLVPRAAHNATTTTEA